MNTSIPHISSLSQLLEMQKLPKPTHPLIAIVDVSKWEIPEEAVGFKATTSFYTIALKDKRCGMLYGRNHYDFDEGVLIFTAPNQVQTVTKSQKIDEINGWMIFFHPDLIRNTSLGKKIDEYAYFSYDVHEALHLSDSEQITITECVNLIKSEICERIDNHSQTVICSSLELLLNLSNRYYERQFNTRSAQNSDFNSQFQSLLKQYYKDGRFATEGIPSIQYFAEKVHLSPSYLSELLKKETGMSTKEQINNFIIEKAKDLLLSENGSVNEIAYSLGFNYPHYFSRLFKSKTNVTPQEYRSLN